MPEPLHIYWGETHHNTYQHYVQDPPLDEVLAYARTYLDFYTGAYYTPAYVVAPPLESAAAPISVDGGAGHLSERLGSRASEWQGVHLEGLKDLEVMAAEWAEFQEITTRALEPGAFVTFPGYEWQGNARWGDHNVILRREGQPISLAETVAELYRDLRPIEALAIPHHTGYYVGQRAPTWAACDDTISPLAEIYSIHGCSETDEEWIGLRHNAHMGPGVSGGTYQQALDLGLHLGAICSTDNWSNMPGCWGQGLAACLARELTREALWEAFCARRVYGVTGDRIRLSFSCNGAPMGSMLAHASRRELRVSVRGCAALDRIELLRNGRVIATHCHQGAWKMPRPGQRSRYLLRIETGWGPRLGEIPLPDQHWQGELLLSDGRFLSWEPCWIGRGQGVPKLEGQQARFTMLTRQDEVGRPAQNATLFEFEAPPEAELILRLKGLELRDTVAAYAAGSRLLWYRNECEQRIQAATGVTPETARRGDAYYQLANKAKVHRAIPEAGYVATLQVTDDKPLERETHYRVRVEQRNGQRAWSSPIWVAAGE